MTPSIGHNCVFYPIFDHHIYIYRTNPIYPRTKFLAATSHQLSLSLSSKCWTVSIFLYIFFAMMLYNNALNMHAGIGVDLRDCFAKRSTIRFLSHLHDKWYILTIIHYCFKHWVIGYSVFCNIDLFLKTIFVRLYLFYSSVLNMSITFSSQKIF